MFNFPQVFQISLLFFKSMYTGLIMKFIHKFQQTRVISSKQKGNLKLFSLSIIIIRCSPLRTVFLELLQTYQYI